MIPSDYRDGSANPASEKRIVMTAVGSMEEAGRIARALVDGKLAACVNVIPKILSIYRWRGKVEEAEECMLLIKTSAAFENVRDAILQLHPYKLPECVSITINEGTAEYLKWIEESCS